MATIRDSLKVLAFSKTSCRLASVIAYGPQLQVPVGTVIKVFKK